PVRRFLQTARGRTPIAQNVPFEGIEHGLSPAAQCCGTGGGWRFEIENRAAAIVAASTTVVSGVASRTGCATETAFRTKNQSRRQIRAVPVIGAPKLGLWKLIARTTGGLPLRQQSYAPLDLVGGYLALPADGNFLCPAFRLRIL